MKDVDGRYMLINRRYETLFNVKNEEMVGKTDYDIFPENVATELRKNDRRILESQTAIEFEEVVVHPDGTPRTYIALKFPLLDQVGVPYAVCGISTDITRQKQAEALLSELSGGLMTVQDAERQRLARELHEGTAQVLAALAMNLGVALRLASEEDTRVRGASEVSLELVQQSASQVQTMAYLLHPPGLDEFGLASVLPWYAQGFSTRSGIQVSVSVSMTLERLERALEVAVFRIVQEALTNILRHSGSKTAEISLRQEGAELILKISDQGQGMPREILSRISAGLAIRGIGIVGMRERVRQLGGVLDIGSGPQGVTLTVTLPARPAGNTA